MNRRELLKNAAAVGPIGAVFAAAAIAHDAGPQTNLVELAWLEPTDEPGWVRLRVAFDRKLVISLRTIDWIVEEALRQADLLLKSIRLNTWSVRAVPEDHIEFGGKWRADLFVQKPEPNSKLGHERNPVGTLRFLLTSVLAEDLCRYAWHRQGRLYRFEEYNAIDERVRKAVPCPMNNATPAEIQAEERLLIGADLAPLQFTSEELDRAIQHRIAKAKGTA